MNWTLPDVRALTMDEFQLLIEILNEEAEAARR